MKELRILRGLPGSSKSTTAKKMELEEGAIVINNDKLMTKGGVYQWDEQSALEAHYNNQRFTAQKMREGVAIIVIDNTNLLPFHVSPYVRLGKYYGYEYKIIQMDSPWCEDVDELVKKNLHAVPRRVLEHMKEEMDACSKEAMHCVLSHEIGMDPEVSLRLAQIFTEEGKFIQTDEQIYDYEDWRYIGGYEPDAGDATLESINDKLQRWRLLME